MAGVKTLDKKRESNQYESGWAGLGQDIFLESRKNIWAQVQISAQMW